MVLLLFASAMVIYCLCTLIELLRIVLFKLFRIKALCMKLDTALTNLFGKLYEKLFYKKGLTNTKTFTILYDVND